MLYLTLGWIRWKYITWKGLLWIASYNVKTCQDCHICCFFELSFATSPPGSPGHPGSEHISESFWEGSEKVLKDFGKNDFGRFGVTFGVTTVTTFQVPRPRCDRHQTLRGQSARRHSGVDSEVLWKGCDCSCLCCTLAIWQYMATWPQVYAIIILYI